MPVAIEFADDVATLTFNRPTKRNALDLATWQAIPMLLALTAERGARVIVLRGAGGNFSAGADIAEFDTVFADRDTTLKYLTLMSEATAAIETTDIPVLAVIEGLCIGAGVAVALACDMRMAAGNARFAITPAKLGLMYSLADTKRVVDAVGPSAAKDLLFTGRIIDADTALAMGLIDEKLADADLDAAVVAKAELISDTSSWTHGRTKSVIRQILNGATSDTAETRGWFADASEGSHFREGLAAFRSRRRPAFPRT